MSGAAITLAQAIEFIWLEADLLDSRDYPAWLNLWGGKGHYIVPIDPEATDFAASLNYAYDDAEMRQARAERLRGGFSMSVKAAARTVRTSSRYRMVAAGADRCEVRCAQLLLEHKRGRQRLYAADVSYSLLATADGLRLERKVVRLADGEDALAGVSYLF